MADWLRGSWNFMGCFVKYLMREITAKAQMLIRRPACEVFEAFANPDTMTKFWFPKDNGKAGNRQGSEMVCRNFRRRF